MLQGFGIRGYRSFNDRDIQRIQLVGRMHFMAGANNSGKSNMLAAVQEYLPKLKLLASSGMEIPAPQDLDIPSFSEVSTFAISVAFDDVDSYIESNGRLSDAQKDTLKRFVSAQAFRRTGADGPVWFDLKPTPGTESRNELPIDSEQLELAQRTIPDMTDAAMGELSSALTSTGGGGQWHDHRRVLSAVCPLHTIPDVGTIPALRRIEPGELSHEGRHSGMGLVGEISLMQNPGVGKDELLEKYRNINEFVRVVVDDDTAILSVSPDAELLIRRDGARALPLSSFGTGLHQAIIIAAAATVSTDVLLCLEEPEMNLHPLLQRRLIAYLYQMTSNRYLIATHSAHLLDSSAPSITHLTLASRVSLTEAVSSPSHLFRIAVELGYRASDLVQSNCIIWVEGPSDRIYLRHWLSMIDPELAEGVHFTVMFYGGSLLSELTPDDPDLHDFISLRTINRNLAILIDSDKRSASDSLNDTKVRVIEAMSTDTDDAVWVTEGYTIENYVPANVLSRAVSKVHPSARMPVRLSRYGNPLALRRRDGKAFAANKARIASQVVETWSEVPEKASHLGRKVRGISGFVRRANELPPRDDV